LDKNSQAILKTRENGENENNFTFTNIEKISYLGYIASCVRVLTDRIRIWKSGDNVNSKSDYIIGL